MTVAEEGSRSDHAKSPKSHHTCQLCNKSYERLDHLNRHLDSHRNARTFKCNECSRGFNRRDLLLRHQATHAKNAAEGKLGPTRSTVRAIVACDSCVISKLKCDDSRPCQRCKKRKIECKADGAMHNGLSATSAQSPRPASTTSPSPLQDLQAQNTSTNSSSSDNVDSHEPSAPGHLPMLPKLGDASNHIDLNWERAFTDIPPFPSFFEHIMAPDFVASNTLNMPPDVLNMIPDNQDWFNDTSDIFGTNFTPTVDQAVEGQLNIFQSGVQHQDGASMDADALASDPGNNAQKRHAIFLRSPWLWKPEANSNAFSEHRLLPLNEEELDIGASPHQPYLATLILQDELSSRSRDRIFQMVLRTVKSDVSIPSFPSAQCLGMLLKVGLAKRIETDAWIHPYTFDSETARPELLTALIAAGCICFGIPSVSKTGLMLFEIVRKALNKLLEDDNSVMRDLQYLQACMLWIDITAFCGYKRKMEIAEQNLQPLVTALRRAGKFDRAAYTKIEPAATDEGEPLDRKWRQWIEQESYKRLVHHVFEHDMYTTVSKARSPVVSYAEMSAPLPAGREVWLAPSSELWQLAFPRHVGGNFDSAWLSVRDLLANEKLLRCIPTSVDGSLAHALHLYGMAGQVWEHLQQTIIVTHSSHQDPATTLWQQTRHQKLYQDLRGVRIAPDNVAPVTALLSEFLMMSLHVNADVVTRFAGKCGELEAHRAYQELQPWSQSKTAKVAVFHAGQVLRAARQVPPYQFREADTFLIYHSIMVLWTYGMMMQRKQVRDAATSCELPDGQAVVLDGESNSRTEAFVLLGQGRPCVQMQGGEKRSPQLCDLRNARAVMQVGVEVFCGNYPYEVRANLPQLVRSLVELLSELGSLK